MIEAMLDKLGEYQSQADLLALKKQELIDAVKIPAEVLVAQDEANKQREAIDRNLWELQTAISDQARAEIEAVKDPEMPPEFVAALAEAKRKRDAIRAKLEAEISQERANANAAKQKIDNYLQAKTASIYAQVATRKAEISAEFDDKASGVLDNIAKLTAEIKQAVKEAKHSVKGLVYQAVYVKGRVTWNTDMLDGMIVAFPELGKARKEGEPSVTLRKV